MYASILKYPKPVSDTVLLKGIKKGTVGLGSLIKGQRLMLIWIASSLTKRRAGAKEERKIIF